LPMALAEQENGTTGHADGRPSAHRRPENLNERSFRPAQARRTLWFFRSNRRVIAKSRMVCLRHIGAGVQELRIRSSGVAEWKDSFCLLPPMEDSIGKGRLRREELRIRSSGVAGVNPMNASLCAEGVAEVRKGDQALGEENRKQESE
jgi:hypothetical protein